MWHYIRTYPISLLTIGVVAYLSFMNPPEIKRFLFPGWDKFVHFCMYGGISGMLWTEFWLHHRRKKANVIYAVVGAVICPVLFGGLIEVGQKYLTVNRSGSWLDVAANSCGVAAATLVAWFVLRPVILNNYKRKGGSRVNEDK